MEKFWKRVAIKGTGECWNWLGYKNHKGYGYFRNNGKSYFSHRVAYELLIGKIPRGLFIDHLCRNRACQNPRHMEPVSRKENTMRGMNFAAMNARKTQCLIGHQFNEANTQIIITKKGAIWRACRECARVRARNTYYKNRMIKYPKGKKLDRKKNRYRDESSIKKAWLLRGEGLSFKKIGEALDFDESSIRLWLVPQREQETKDAYANWKIKRKMLAE